MGGAEREVCYLAQAFHRRGWEVAAISMLPLERPVSELEAEGIYTSSLGMRRGLPDPRALGRLRGFIRRWQPDVLHAHMVHANLLARLSRLVVKTPVVISTIHSQDEGAQWRYVAYRLTDRLSDVTTTVSQVAMAEAIRRGAVRPGSILLVPNGIGTSAYVRDASIRERIRASLGLGDRFTWLAVGRLVEAKGYLDMLAAFRQVREHHPGAVLMIAGNGPLEELIRTTARQAGIEHGVTLLGLRQDVPALMQAADAFVMSSKWEGLPMVLLEAGASSLPIVATDVGGSRDAILDGVSGHLTPAGDPVALAQAMCHVMKLGVRDREAMGAAGRGHICRTFDIEVVVDMWEALYAGAGSVRAHGSPAL
jgi:glycosyltransferase involved in cell wall biosynthesis